SLRGEHLVTKLGDDLGKRGGSRFDHFPRDSVRVDDERPVCGKTARHRTLPRTDPAGQSHFQHADDPTDGPRHTKKGAARLWATPVSLWSGSAFAAARELLPQRGQGLVGGELSAALTRTAVVVGLLLLSSRGLGSLGFLDLLAVRFEAGLSQSVLALPLVALGLVALHPLAGLRVEALRVLVVAVFVVLGNHAVHRRVELGLVRRDALVGLLQRQADAAPVQVDVDDLDEDLGAHLNNL